MLFSRCCDHHNHSVLSCFSIGRIDAVLRCSHASGGGTGRFVDGVVLRKISSGAGNAWAKLHRAVTYISYHCPTVIRISADLVDILVQCSSKTSYIFRGCSKTCLALLVFAHGGRDENGGKEEFANNVTGTSESCPKNSCYCMY